MKSIPGQRKPIVTRETWVEKVLPFVAATILTMLILMTAGAVK